METLRGEDGEMKRIKIDVASELGRCEQRKQGAKFVNLEINKQLG